MMAVSARLERMASFPPRRSTAFPDFRQRVAPSTVTLGRLSKMIPTMPMGTRTFSIRRPLGRKEPPSTTPTGSSSWMSFLTPSQMPPIRSSVRVRRSMKPSVSPFSRPAFTSSSFAFKISSRRSQRTEAMTSRQRFFSAVPAFPMIREASLPRRPNSSISIVVFSFQGRVFRF